MRFSPKLTITMTNKTTDRDSVIREIDAAFSGVRRDDGISLYEAAVIDDHGSVDERMRARARDTEECWQDVPAADIECYYYILSFLDADGFHYYLPAYMVWSLRSFETTDSLSVDHTIYSLARHAEPELAEWQMERFSAFTSEQAKAILSFLRYMAQQSRSQVDTDAASAAIADYWLRIGQLPH